VPTRPETLDERLRAAGSLNANATGLQEQNIAAWPAPELQHLRAFASSDSGHDKLPGDGHEVARWRT
jgi:hypothetical protein